MQRDLIFDLGLCHGADTEFYLKKGFKVVAVEANPELCRLVERRFASAVESQRLIVVNRAIATEPGPITFYQNLTVDGWGTVDPEWAARNARLGRDSSTIVVEAVTMADLLAEFGVPYYMKVDIEGFDMVAVKALTAIKQRPKFISVESEKDSFKALRREFEVLHNLGYNAFKIVNQIKVPKQRAPRVAKEGDYVQHVFTDDSSGLFGEEAPGRWMRAEEAIEAYRPIFLRYALTGDDPFVRSKPLRLMLKALGLRQTWYDTHARLDSAWHADLQPPAPSGRSSV